MNEADEARAAAWRETQQQIALLRLRAARALAAPAAPYRQVLANWAPWLPGQLVPRQGAEWR